MKILMISSTFPYPPTKGGTHGRTFNLLKMISQEVPITLVTQRSPDISDEDVEKLSQFVDQLVLFPRPVDVNPNILGKIKNIGQFLLSGTPPNVRFLQFNGAMQDWIDEAVKTNQFQVITAEHSANEVFIRPQWQDQLRTVIDIHSSVYRTCKNQLETKTSSNELRDRLFLPLLRRYERQTICKFSQIVVTTDEDERQMKEFAPDGEVSLIPNGVDLSIFPYRKSDPGGHRLVFVGGLDYFVNIDGAVFLGQEILPLVQEKYPDTTLTLVGSKPSPEVLALAKRPGITVTGRVPSIAEYLHQATVAVIPLRTGFGMKFKTLESMAAGVPVVGSDRALEGLSVDSSNVPLRALRANQVSEYVSAISRLFEDAPLRERLSHNGRVLIEQEYTWEYLGKQYTQLITGTPS
ncbi:glycosyl transferase family 1 [Aphanothece hegewaldii CCALA 016]|uniref:Glycosyl transferase family 1 n=1 Tax=Aphanothece hegewaldii CCALA 016 TaxID=2107694 RepID=A0A2T1LV22_9CHRO|nr:glycosyltransferase family 4 protein [Aphanothece hegewaldii]PSF35529.1 glycosyl transferase family 1 [Aphanothece hegewaldii CCALA 016]